MSVFKFRLQKLLELREWKEREAAGHLADARKRAEETRQTRTALEAVRQASRQQLVAAHGAGGRIGHLHNLTTVLEYLDEKIQEAETRCRAAEADVERRRGEFVEAVRERRVLDQLRERAEEVWKADQVRKERKAMDDVALTRHARAGDVGSSATP